MELEFWLDPICPWCWVTARWLMDEVEPNRDLDITWQPISLFAKNQPDPDSEYYERTWFTHRLLRVLESVRRSDGDGAVQPLYWEFGRRIHHDKESGFPAADALAAVGLPTSHADAFDDGSWDSEIEKRMAVGIELAGDNVGTPIIGMADDDGQKVALFGPVITRVPSTEQSLRLWDAYTAIVTVPGFWELKRTRTESPEPGPRP